MFRWKARFGHDFARGKERLLQRLRQGIVERALAVAFEVERDVEEAGGFEACVDGGGHVGSKGAREFLPGDFDTGEPVVETDTELTEAEVAEGGFGAVDEREALGRDFGAVGNAGGEASGRGAIPCRKVGAARKFADFGFAEADIEERREDVMLGGGTMAWAEVERVVGVDAVGDGGDIACGGELVEDGEEFVLAEVTAIARVRAVRGVFHFVSFDEFVANGELLEERSELVAVVRGITRRDCCDRECAVPESFVCGPGEVGGVGSAGEGDDEGRKFCEIGEELGFLLLRRGRGRFVETNLNDGAHNKSIAQEYQII